MHTGDNIRKFRDRASINIETLAEKTNIDSKYLVSIEEGKEEATVSDLLKIAGVLKIDIAALLYGKEFDRKGARVTKPEGRVRVERKRSFDYESLSPYYSGRHIEPFIVDVYPVADTEKEYSTHTGEEFHYVMDGTVRLEVDKETFTLETGDTIYFDASLPHSLSAVSDKAKILVAIYNGESMVQKTRSRKMKGLIQGAKHLGGRDVVVIIPNTTALEAVNQGIEEEVIRTAYFVGDSSTYPKEHLVHPDSYRFLEVSSEGENYDGECACKRG